MGATSRAGAHSGAARSNETFQFLLDPTSFSATTSKYVGSVATHISIESQCDCPLPIVVVNCGVYTAIRVACFYRNSQTNVVAMSEVTVSSFWL